MKRLLQFFYYPGPPAPEFVRVPKPQQSAYAFYHSFGLLFNWRACWMGWHYSKRDKRLCINLVPCLTIWWTQPGGNTP